MAGLVFTGNAQGFAGQPLHVTTYDVANNPVDPTTISWGTLPVGMTSAPDHTTTPPSTVFNCPTVSQGNLVHAVSGVAAGTLQINFVAPPLQFTSP